MSELANLVPYATRLGLSLLVVQAANGGGARVDPLIRRLLEGAPWHAQFSVESRHELLLRGTRGAPLPAGQVVLSRPGRGDSLLAVLPPVTAPLDACSQGDEAIESAAPRWPRPHQAGLVSVLVTVTTPRASLDLELDDGCRVAELAPELASAFGETCEGVLALDDGTPLDPSATLAAAGVLDGQRLALLDARGQRDRRRLGHRYEPAGGAFVLPRRRYFRLRRRLRARRRQRRARPARRRSSRRPPRPRAVPAGLLAFDTDAQVVVASTPASALDHAPRLSATRAGTDYESVFRLLRQEIDQDIDGLRMAGFCRFGPSSSC